MRRPRSCRDAGDRRRSADHGGPRQRRDHAGYGNAAAAHRAHVEPRAAALRRPEGEGRQWRRAAGCRAHAARHDGPAAAAADDGKAADNIHVIARTFGLLVLLLLASTAAEPAGADAKEKELRELRSRIEALQKQIAGAEESKSEAADALRESERAISEANRSLRELGAQSKEINRELAELTAEARRNEESLKTQQLLLARL